MPPPFFGHGGFGRGPGGLIGGLIGAAVVGGVVAATAPPPRRYYNHQVYDVAPRGQRALGPNERMILVTCPAGVGPGSSVELEVEGQQFRVTVPPGVRPGQQFYARVTLKARVSAAVPVSAAASSTTGPATTQAAVPTFNSEIPEAQTVQSSDAPVAEVQRAPPSAAASAANPFGPTEEAQPNSSSGWVISPYKAEFDQFFYAQGPQGGKLSPSQVKTALLTTGLQTTVLRSIWELSDIDKDGQLDMDEFAVAMYLCRQSQANQSLPSVLPSEMVPPSKQSFFGNPF